MRTTTDRPIRMGMTPPHPGEFIRTEILDPLDLTVTAAARVLGVSRPTLSSLLNGQADLPATWRCGSRRPSGSTWRP